MEKLWKPTIYALFFASLIVGMEIANAHLISVKKDKIRATDQVYALVTYYDDVILLHNLQSTGVSSLAKDSIGKILAREQVTTKDGKTFNTQDIDDVLVCLAQCFADVHQLDRKKGKSSGKKPIKTTDSATDKRIRGVDRSPHTPD